MSYYDDSNAWHKQFGPRRLRRLAQIRDRLERTSDGGGADNLESSRAVYVADVGYLLEAVARAERTIRNEVSTVVMDSAYEEAVRWHDEFLDQRLGIRPPLPNQLVCYLIADCMTLRKLIDLARSTTGRIPRRNRRRRK